MKKIIFSVALSAISALNLAALDITTVDGKVYKNVEITNVLPNAIDFTYDKKDGTEVVRGVKMTSLTKDLQEKFKYSPEKAKAFEKQVEQFQAARDRLYAKHYKEYLALIKEQQKTSKELDDIKAVLHAHRIKCWAHIIRPVGEDCIAKVTMPRSAAKYGYIGEVYIRNLTGPQDERIGTVIYPTGETMAFEDGVFPVYDADLTKYALLILKEHESGDKTDLEPKAKPMYFPVNAPKTKK